jgi:hypothetical protein
VKSNKECNMSTISVEELYLKDLLKQAILELVQERRDLFQDILVEALEDLALARAIEEGESTEVVSKVEILQILEGTA